MAKISSQFPLDFHPICSENFITNWVEDLRESSQIIKSYFSTNYRFSTRLSFPGNDIDRHRPLKNLSV